MFNFVPYTYITYWNGLYTNFLIDLFVIVTLDFVVFIINFSYMSYINIYPYIFLYIQDYKLLSELSYIIILQLYNLYVKAQSDVIYKIRHMQNPSTTSCLECIYLWRQEWYGFITRFPNLCIKKFTTCRDFCFILLCNLMHHTYITQILLSSHTFHKLEDLVWESDLFNILEYLESMYIIAQWCSYSVNSVQWSSAVLLAP